VFVYLYVVIEKNLCSVLFYVFCVKTDRSFFYLKDVVYIDKFVVNTSFKKKMSYEKGNMPTIHSSAEFKDAMPVSFRSYMFTIFKQ